MYELDYETLETIRESVREVGEKKNSSLLILDDVTVALTDNDMHRELKDVIFNRRQCRLLIVVLVHSRSRSGNLCLISQRLSLGTKNICRNLRSAV